MDKKAMIATLQIAIAMLFFAIGMLAGCSGSYAISNNTEYPAEWRIEELGERIVAANEVWEDWWLLRGRFSRENQDFGAIISYPSLGVKLLSESGFESLSEVRNYLLKYYTENWVDWQLSRDFPIFLEHNNTLFINPDGSAYGLSYTSFRNATHTLVEQEGGRVIVRTMGLSGSWHMKSCCPWDEIEWMFEYVRCYYFVFIDGKIDSIIVPTWEWPLFGREDE